MRVVREVQLRPAWGQTVLLRIDLAVILSGAAAVLAIISIVLDRLAGTKLITPSALTLFSVIALTVWKTIARSHFYPVFGLPNCVTLLRSMIVCVMAGVLFAGQAEIWAWPLVAFAVIALMLDGVDGWASRCLALSSRFGARFDMETDALCLLVLSALVADIGKVGPFIMIIGLARYGFFAAGRLFPGLAKALPTSRRRKVICVCQGVALTACLAPIVSPLAAIIVSIIALVLLTYSFAMDIVWLLVCGQSETEPHAGSVSANA